jgi:hypothetical protein
MEADADFLLWTRVTQTGVTNANLKQKLQNIYSKSSLT